MAYTWDNKVGLSTVSDTILTKQNLVVSLKKKVTLWKDVHLLDMVETVVDKEITETLHSLEQHRNVTCLSALYGYYCGNCSLEVYSCIPPSYIFSQSI